MSQDNSNANKPSDNQVRTSLAFSTYQSPIEKELADQDVLRKYGLDLSPTRRSLYLRGSQAYPWSADSLHPYYSGGYGYQYGGYPYGYGWNRPTDVKVETKETEKSAAPTTTTTTTTPTLSDADFYKKYGFYPSTWAGGYGGYPYGGQWNGQWGGQWGGNWGNDLWSRPEVREDAVKLTTEEFTKKYGVSPASLHGGNWSGYGGYGYPYSSGSGYPWGYSGYPWARSGDVVVSKPTETKEEKTVSAEPPKVDVRSSLSLSDADFYKKYGFYPTNTGLYGNSYYPGYAYGHPYNWDGRYLA